MVADPPLPGAPAPRRLLVPASRHPQTRGFPTAAASRRRRRQIRSSPTVPTGFEVPTPSTMAIPLFGISHVNPSGALETCDNEPRPPECPEVGFYPASS
ncbi:hypothetical protein MLD38_027930 [Melastoma candidum]|uniref:Uncharacterized protein n=1 Tax=Melastoma candidum TaxID=119954 RepID=A0ACB9N1S2_9MYRT|nr:hypothetical protein MLD38_027930 [Melastoma candidum]